MRTGLFCLALMLPSVALAGPRQVGLSGSLGGGLSVGMWSPPASKLRFAAGVASQATFSVWWGGYDADYVMGRYWAAGVAFRHSAHGQGHRLSPMVEFKKGMDLIVAGLSMHLAIGPELWLPDGGGTDLGGLVLFGATAKYRPHRNVGPFLRLEGGVAYESQHVVPRLNFTVGVDFAGPLKRGSIDGI